MDRRRKLLVSQYELATDAILAQVAGAHGARVFAKVRVADALDIQASGLTDDEYHYALQAHFDFVVADRDTHPHFAVEFDGQYHESDAQTIRRDSLKCSICEKLGLPLLRIDSNFFRKVGRFILLGWLAEVWFLHRAFCEAQEIGQIPPWEEFDYKCVLGTAYRKENRLVSIDHLRLEDQAQLLYKHRGRIVFTRPYDPFVGSRAFIIRTHERGACRKPIPAEMVGTNRQGRVVAVSTIPVAGDRVIVGHARVRSYQFPPVTPHEVAIELSVVDAAEKLKLYLQGQHPGSPVAEVEEWRAQMSRWKGHS